MKAVLINPDHTLNYCEIADPVLKAGYVIIDVKAAGVNRADLLQVAGKYPPPAGWPDYPGLECSGVIAQAAPGSCWKAGDKVCALLGGGGYAQKVLVPEGMVLPMPENTTFAEAAALPEVYTTAMLNLKLLGDLKSSESVFIQAGANGLGIAAIQIAKIIGAKVVTTVGSPEKAAAVRQLGADTVIERKTQAVDEVLKNITIDVALDCAGGELMGKCLDAMNPGGRWILVATLGGETTQIPLRTLLKKHLHIMGSTLRSRSDVEKSQILSTVKAMLWQKIADGSIRPLIDQTFALADADKAHKVLAEQKNIGKVVLICD